MISLIAVMNKTIHKGTSVVQRDVGEISGICYNDKVSSSASIITQMNAPFAM